VQPVGCLTENLQMKQDIFQAIADPTRRAILTLLTLHALTPNAMAEKFDMSRQAVSKHIKVLHECELIKPEQSGREIYYHFNAKKCRSLTTGWPNLGKTGKLNLTSLTDYYHQLKNRPRSSIDTNKIIN
jgi:DNA-binding transcriptional ArsR family regulator